METSQPSRALWFECYGARLSARKQARMVRLEDSLPPATRAKSVLLRSGASAWNRSFRIASAPRERVMARLRYHRLRPPLLPSIVSYPTRLTSSSTLWSRLASKLLATRLCSKNIPA